MMSAARLNLGHLSQQNQADHDAMGKALATYGRVLEFDSGNIEADYQSAVLLERREAFKASLDHLSRLPADQGKAPALAAPTLPGWETIGGDKPIPWGYLRVPSKHRAECSSVWEG
jgi:hypothetical protein